MRWKPWWIVCVVLIPVVLSASGRRPAPVIREAEWSGTSFLLLDDVAVPMSAKLLWDSAAKRVDFSFQSHHIQFFIASNKTVIDGQSSVLETAPVHNAQGVWVPKTFFQSGPLAKEFERRIELEKPKASTTPPVKPQAAQVPVAPPTPPPTVSAPPVKTVPPEPVQPEPPRRAINRVVIDPGHGGKDPGAVGIKGTAEKTINLWMARELADILRERDFEVLLTRTDDSFVPLAARAALANKYKADLFISVHCNASVSSKLSGFEVYFLSEKASDPHADEVARKENASLEFEGKSASTEVDKLLRSLEKNTHINQAAQLGGIIDRQVGRHLKQAHLGVKQAAFYVLRDARMPAVLIELGFLSNRGDEKRLLSSSHRERLIRAIEASILEYDQKQPRRPAPRVSGLETRDKVL